MDFHEELDSSPENVNPIRVIDPVLEEITPITTVRSYKEVVANDNQ